MPKPHILEYSDFEECKFEQIIASSSYSAGGDSKQLLSVVTCTTGVDESGGSMVNYEVRLNYEDYYKTGSLEDAIDEYNSLG